MELVGSNNDESNLGQVFEATNKRSNESEDNDPSSEPWYSDQAVAMTTTTTTITQISHGLLSCEASNCE
jgi:hypothetical protein